MQDIDKDTKKQREFVERVGQDFSVKVNKAAQERDGAAAARAAREAAMRIVHGPAQFTTL
jgi:hypothetical protein